MASGTPTERKAAIETLIAEVQLTDQGVIPVFKIPTDTTMPPPNPDGGIPDEQPPVRTVVRSVGRRHHHANHTATIAGNPLPLSLRRSRARGVPDERHGSRVGGCQGLTPQRREARN